MNAAQKARLEAEYKRIDARIAKSGKELNEIFAALADNMAEQARAVVFSQVGLSYNDLVRQTPVDSGRARAGWHIEDNANEWKPEKGEYPEAKGAAAPVIGREQQKLMALYQNGGDRIVVQNNVEYIAPLEAGWSRQGGGFFALFLERVRARLSNGLRAMSR